MAVCSRCGREFDLHDARHRTGIRYGAGSYNDYFPDGDVCDWCADEQIGADYATGEDLKELMGPGWDDD